jgi:uroporphyrinogen-III synthase
MVADRGPLAGRRVVITRPKEQSAALRGLLERAGAEVIEFPMITAVPPEDGGTELAMRISAVDHYDWLVVTSPNGARAVRDARSGDAVPDVRVAAVGRATAEALGWPVELVPGRHDATALAEAFPPGPGRLLLVQGDLAPATLGNALIRKGWRVDHVIGYLTRSAAPDPGMIEAVSRADVITFASGSAVRAFIDNVGRDAMPGIVVTLGASTAATAQELEVAVTGSANSNTLADLGLAVVAACRRAQSDLRTNDDTTEPTSPHISDDR